LAARQGPVTTHRAGMECSRVSSAIRKAVRLRMSHPTLLADHEHDRRPRLFLLAGLVVLFMAAMTAKASATIEVQNYNDPAGDPTTFTYQLTAASDPTRVLASDVLGDGGKRSFGPDPAKYGPTYTVHAVLPPGWQTVAINCVNKPGSATFTTDLANSSVTISPHTIGEDHYCAFTNRKITGPGASPGGGTGGGGTGVAPSTPGGGTAGAATAPALLRVVGGTHYASAKVRITRASTIKGALRWKGKTVGTARLKKTKAGTYTIKVKLSEKWQRTFKRQGRKKVTLSFKVTVVGDNKATKTFTSGVIVRL
jgi:hypothetical protein